jgi:hypothetical protein
VAAIKNQPAPKPSQIGSPVPNEDALAAFNAAADELAASVPPPANAEAMQAFEQSAAPAPSQEVTPNPGIMGTIADYAPVAGGIVGGIIGTPADVFTGPVGTAVGAGLGAYAGHGLKRLIETNVFNKPVESFANEAEKAANEAIFNAAATYTGEKAIAGASKAIGAAAKTELGQQAVEGISKLAAAPLKWMKQTIAEAGEKLTAPLLKVIAEKTTNLDANAAGAQVKNLLVKNINEKYGAFKNAYGTLDNVTTALPLKDEARRGFTQDLKSWVTESFPSSSDKGRMVTKFANDIDASNTGAHFKSVIGDIRDAKAVAFKNGATEQGKFLAALENKANDFYEAQITGLAKRVSKGVASPEELNAFNQMVAATGGEAAAGVTTTGAQGAFARVSQDPKALKKVATDYLEAADKIKNDYAGFRSFLSDVGEQAKIKAERLGPMSFLSKLDEVPSEKLMERMFDPKNADALRVMAKETPEVFEQVVKSKMNNLIAKASPDGVLDLPMLRKEIYKLPEASRNILMKSDELKVMNEVLNNPRLARIQQLDKLGDTAILKWAKDVAEVTRTVGAAAGKKVINSPAGSQAVGRPVISGMQSMMAPKQGEQ